MQTAATGGTSGCLGSGRRAWAHSERTLPGVSAPSSVVRSIIETARSRACSLLAALMLRVASAAERRSSPTWSTPGSPCRNRRSPDSVPVTSASAAAVSAGGAPPEPLRPASCCRGDGTVVVTDVETTRPGRSTGRTREGAAVRCGEHHPGGPSGDGPRPGLPFRGTPSGRRGSSRWRSGGRVQPDDAHPDVLQAAAVEVAAQLVGLDRGQQSVERAVRVDLAGLRVDRQHYVSVALRELLRRGD